MKYAKPTVAFIGVASNAIQGHGNKAALSPDANTSSEQMSTGSSYDLDE